MGLFASEVSSSGWKIGLPTLLDVLALCIWIIVVFYVLTADLPAMKSPLLYAPLNVAMGGAYALSSLLLSRHFLTKRIVFLIMIFAICIGLLVTAYLGSVQFCLIC
jgi:uncharacterized membrane protein AbrB (regulator of aidB expression)